MSTCTTPQRKALGTRTNRARPTTAPATSVKRQCTHGPGQPGRLLCVVLAAEETINISRDGIEFRKLSTGRGGLKAATDALDGRDPDPVRVLEDGAHLPKAGFATLQAARIVECGYAASVVAVEQRALQLKVDASVVPRSVRRKETRALSRVLEPELDKLLCSAHAVIAKFDPLGCLDSRFREHAPTLWAEIGDMHGPSRRPL